VTREMRPEAVDWNRVWAKTPTKVNKRMLKPSDEATLAWRLWPRMPIKMKGNMKLKTMRMRSRKSLVTSRAAIAMMAFSSWFMVSWYPE